ncbi:sensor histidine kinase [Brevibacillus dissolubilis]|uniref:sensor histidine kinase n=1 Tax=Brevibacillus dissolubilis TaxID=1844116 RepID=UPI0021002FA8|nr:sensor histidine kinase [Brevibacillus dissolubilis]
MLTSIRMAIQKRLMIIWFIALLLLAWLPNAYLRETPVQLSLSVLLFCCYLWMFWVSQRWWNPVRIKWSVMVLGSLTLAKGYWLGGESIGIIMLLSVFIGLRMEDKVRLWYAAVFLILAALLMYVQINAPLNALTAFTLTYIGCYLGALGYRVTNEAFKEKQIHLEELQKAHEELQDAHTSLQEATVTQMQMAVLEERTRIARDIHDEVGHSLTSIIVQMRALKYMLQDGPANAQEVVENMLSVAKESLDEIRSSIHTLAIDKMTFGLTPLRALLSQTEKNTGLTCNFTAPDEEIYLPNEIMIVLYRTLQEAITNALRHSEATQLDVTMVQNDDGVSLSIRDNGKITPKDPITPGFGLTGLHERITKLHGTLDYRARQPHGFQIDATIPYQFTSTEEDV